MNRRVVQFWITLMVVGALALPLGVAVHPQVVYAQDDVASRIDALHATAPTLSEGFRAPNKVWEVSTDSANSSMRFETGTYRVGVTDPSLFAWGVADETAADLFAEVDGWRTAGPENNEFGIVFRQQDNDNFYTFMISSDGFYTLRKLDGGEWTDIIAWTTSDLIDLTEGAVNRLGVFADGTSITVLINDEVVDQADDDTFAEGTMGLAAGSFEEGGVEVAFDDFAMWDLAQEGEPNGLITPEPTVTEEAAPESTPEPTPVVMVPMPEIPTSEPDFSEEFRTDTGSWAIESDDTATYSLHNRELSIEVLNPNAVAWSNWNVSYPADFVVEADATQVSGPTSSEFGIMFRVLDNANFYFYAIAPDGSYSLWKMVDNQWSELIPWTTSESILTGDQVTNRLGVQTQGALIWLLANDEVVGQFEDDSITQGQVALAVGTFDEGNVKVVFDNVDLWVITEGTPPATPEAHLTPEAEVTPEAQVRPEAQVTPEAQITPVAPDVAAHLDEIRATDPTQVFEFRRDDGTWSASEDEGANFFYQARAYHERVDSPQWMTWSLNDNLTVSDFLAEIDVAHVAGPENAEQGLVFRVGDDNFYFYAISANGYYTLLKRENGEWFTIVDWTEASELNSGPSALNRIGVLAEGSTLTLLANGIPVTQVTDEAFTEGTLGVAAGTFDEGGLEVTFDNLSFWDLSGQ